jgi:hypothetical protein
MKAAAPEQKIETSEASQRGEGRKPETAPAGGANFPGNRPPAGPEPGDRIERMLDRVNHDELMVRVARKVKDRRRLGLIRRYLRSGIMQQGLVAPRREGTPQGGPLSPLLANILRDDLDKELEKRGHRFCRYADDCNIYVGSQRAGERVMASLMRIASCAPICAIATN